MIRFTGVAPIAAVAALVPALMSVGCSAASSSAAAVDGRENVAREVRAVEQRRVQALTGGDFAALETLLADDLTYTHSNGRVQSKAELLAALRSGEIKYEAMNHEDVLVRTYGDTAVLTGHSLLEVRANGHAHTLPVRFTLVYVERGAQWRMVAWQSTTLPTP